MLLKIYFFLKMKNFLQWKEKESVFYWTLNFDLLDLSSKKCSKFWFQIQLIEIKSPKVYLIAILK